MAVEGVSMEKTSYGPIAEASGRWWLFIVTGIIYILFSLVVLRFDKSSITAVGVVTGLMLLALGFGDILAAFVSDSWKWLYGLLGAVMTIGGVMAIVYPNKTFLVLAEIIGFVFVVVGALRIVEAFMLKGEEFWWATLVGGILMLLLGFWAGGRFYLGRSAYLILVWVGFGALIRGVMQIVMAFQLRGIHKDLTR
jgi:Short repeat of unknown function (DUF308)